MTSSSIPKGESEYEGILHQYKCGHLVEKDECYGCRYDALKQKVEELKDQLHRARLLWANSKRDPETGFCHIIYLDQFDRAISGDKEALEAK